MKITIVPKIYELPGKIWQKLVRSILKEYCKKNGAKVVHEIDLSIVFVHDTELPFSGQLGYFQMVDGPAECVILLNSEEWFDTDPDSEEPVKVLIHEIIHYCQYVTGRYAKPTSKDYHFKPDEIEAKGLCDYFYDKFVTGVDNG